MCQSLEPLRATSHCFSDLCGLGPSLHISTTPYPRAGCIQLPWRAAECTVKRLAIAAAARMARRHRTAAPAPRPASPLRRARALAEARAESRARGVGRTRRSRAARTGSEEPAPAVRGILPHPLGCGASRWRRSRRSGSYQGSIGRGRAAAPAVLSSASRRRRRLLVFISRAVRRHVDGVE